MINKMADILYALWDQGYSMGDTEEILEEIREGYWADRHLEIVYDIEEIFAAAGYKIETAPIQKFVEEMIASVTINTEAVANCTEEKCCEPEKCTCEKKTEVKKPLPNGGHVKIVTNMDPAEADTLINDWLCQLGLRD